MPTYEFHCNECDSTFDVEESISEHERDVSEHRTTCPGCGAADVSPQVTAFEVRTSRKSA